MEDGRTVPDYMTQMCTGFCLWGYMVQVRTVIGLWVGVKYFYDPYDPDFAKREAEELLDKLNEK